MHKVHQENLDKMVQEDHLYVNFCNAALVDLVMNTYLYARMHVNYTHTRAYTQKDANLCVFARVIMVPQEHKVHLEMKAQRDHQGHKE